VAAVTERHLPNFFIAGAPKAGTTALYFYLRQHPQVYMSPVKGPTFFGAADLLSGPHGDQVRRDLPAHRAALAQYLDGTRVSGGMPLVLDWQDYLSLFANVREETAIGEGSVGYFRLPGAPRAIRSIVPGARLLFILRDPAERLFTAHLGTLWQGSRATFRARLLAARDPRDPWAPSLDAGRYATHLTRWLDVFPRERVRIHLYEDYRADAGAVLRDIFAFLGVAPDHPIDLSRRHNETVVPRFGGVHALRRRVLGSRSLPGWMPAGARRVLRRLYRRPRQHLTLDPEDRCLAIDQYREEIERTADLIGRDLSAWLR
jgi:Sulfotransferase family